MRRKYNKPPIIEVVCEFRFDQTAEWDLTIPGLLFDKTKDRYPNRKQLKVAEFLLPVPLGTNTPQAVVEDRIHLVSSDEKSIVQVGRHFLAIIKLAPYSSWEEYLPAIQNALSKYLEVGRPKALVRVSLKYINRIVIPKSQIRMEEYFEFYPHVGPSLPQVHGPFFIGVEFAYERDRDKLRVQLQSAMSENQNDYSLLLDLEYYALGLNVISFETASNWLEEAHARIESAFEGCLTDTATQHLEVV
ncbi:MAG: TIGR04255 family protein [Candidatus Acidiferrales bacterium]